jgi:hypothetical protein
VSPWIDWIWTGGWPWLLLKVFCSSPVLLFMWFRATFPRYRYDQIMRLGWKVFIPITIVWIFVTGVAGVLRRVRGGAVMSHETVVPLLQEPAAAGTAPGHVADR